MPLLIDRHFSRPSSGRYRVIGFTIQVAAFGRTEALTASQRSTAIADIRHRVNVVARIRAD
jgi:hypothetical protein